MSLLMTAVAKALEGRGLPLRERVERLDVCREALGWLGTPYHPHGRVKGAGVDCATILIEVFVAAGLVTDYDPGYYPPDWHLHRDEERYLASINKFCKRSNRTIENALPGDVALFQFGRTISHGAIMLATPMVIHSYIGRGVVLDDATNGELAADAKGNPRIRGLWSFWEK